MCTIGAVINKNGRLIMFKNVDLTFQWAFAEPEVIRNNEMTIIEFPSFMDRSQEGIWAGMNSKGLGIYGADGDALFNKTDKEYSKVDMIRKAYKETLENNGSVKNAYHYLIEYYKMYLIGGDGDLILMADPYEICVLEYGIDKWGIQFYGRESYAFRTNFYTVLKQYSPSMYESSRYLSHRKRYETLMGQFSKKSHETTVEDIKEILRDHTHGPSAMSICRHGGQKEFFTQASNIMAFDNGTIDIYYALNGYPCRTEYIHRSWGA